VALKICETALKKCFRHKKKRIRIIVAMTANLRLDTVILANPDLWRKVGTYSIGRFGLNISFLSFGEAGKELLLSVDCVSLLSHRSIGGRSFAIFSLQVSCSLPVHRWAAAS
jgi:hypothetical protein